jgi:hypothetical protein
MLILLTPLLYRASFARGVPPYIAKAQHDVPIPTSSNTIAEAERLPEGLRDGESFIALCKLTEIVGDILSLVYNLRDRSREEVIRGIRRLEADLDDWEESLSESLNPHSERELPIPGSTNLKLSFLVIRMLFRRITLHVRVNRNTTTIED